MIVTPSIENLAEAARAEGRKGRPPVEAWDPPDCGDIDMEIARDGTWYYMGTPIGRPELVRLFASILRREGARHVLVTPVEKLGIRVEDAPFVVQDFEASGTGRDQTLTFFTNVADAVTAGPDHPIRVVRDPRTDEPAPYVHVRGRLEALIDRKSFYRLVELGRHEARDGGRWFGLWSGGAFFPIIPSAELPEG